jgi:hypothetical protein
MNVEPLPTFVSILSYRPNLPPLFWTLINKVSAEDSFAVSLISYERSLLLISGEAPIN